VPRPRWKKVLSKNGTSSDDRRRSEKERREQQAMAEDGAQHF